MRDFLVEIHTEELPPKTLKRLATHFLQEVESRIKQAGLNFETAHYFATPRRLAVLVKKLVEKQADSVVERKGPAIQAAYDKEGNPTPACLGFAKSCDIDPKRLITLKTAQGEWVGFKQAVKGKTVRELLPTIVKDSLASLPIAKRMRWGDNTIEFVRPVHSVIMLYGDKVISGDILGLKADRKTHGHRFLSKAWISIPSAATYEEILENQFVIADFERRKTLIRHEIDVAVLNTLGEQASAVVDEALLDEVTGLVEWPVAMCGSFDETFLNVPKEALISAMQDHQRYFPIVDKKTNKILLPNFITIINIKTKSPMHVIAGNERVLRARLSDAAFFYTTDKKTKLEERVESLKNIIFQAKLGTLFDKSERIKKLAVFMAQTLSIDKAQTELASMLAKTDLTTQLVGEFPELQGIAGYHYAIEEKLPGDVPLALKEQYHPRFSGDVVPTTPLGSIIAIADRLDTLVGAFGINQIPTGDKDPLGLRRAALGVLRILIENKINLDLQTLVEQAFEAYSHPLANKETVPQVLHFMLERLKPWYQEQLITPDVIAAVSALNITKPYDMHRRILAVQGFKNLPEAAALSVANKRVSNILSKYEEAIVASTIDSSLFENDIEKTLATQVADMHGSISSLSNEGEYPEILTKLASLREPVDHYFDKILVMVDNKSLRENRLLLLKQLRGLFLHVADIALLQ
jgi:glycyl-tRNA synthetase beta chain